jgi:cytidine deaminase
LTEHEIEALVTVARDAARTAYAPYSKYPVGAAVRTKSGRVFAGCNVENASYGVTICAERAAIVQMALAGEREIDATAIFVDAPEPAAPCGICRQAIVEFSHNAEVVCATRTARVVSRMSELLPRPFKASALLP